MDPRRAKQTELWALVGFYASLGFILPIGAVGGFVLGWYADRWLHTSPVLSVTLGFLGAASGFIEVLRLLKRAEKRANGTDSNDRPHPS